MKYIISIVVTSTLIFCQGCFSTNVIVDAGIIRQSLDNKNLVIKSDEGADCWRVEYAVRRRFYWLPSMMRVLTPKFLDFGDGVTTQWFVKKEKQINFDELHQLQSIVINREQKKLPHIKEGQLPVVSHNKRYSYEYNGFMAVRNGVWLCVFRKNQLGNTFSYEIYQTKELRLYDSSFTPFYGYFIKAVELPFALVADVITSPGQLFLWWVATHMKI